MTQVARRVRAWIETCCRRGGLLCCCVARRVRAWIETLGQRGRRQTERSPAVCGRGLKHSPAAPIQAKPFVARRVRAWIETVRPPIAAFGQRVARRVRAWIETGLTTRPLTPLEDVARRVRAWIETADPLT